MDEKRGASLVMFPGNQPRTFALSLSFIICLCGTVFAQADKRTNLSRDDVVIRREKPTLYMCVDRELTQAKRKEGGADVWLRLYNNTIWVLKFKAERMGTPSAPMRLSNGNTVAALTNNSVSFPQYQFELRNGSREYPWGDVSTSNWLPSNTFTTFKVPAKDLKDSKVFLEFKYEWELIGMAGQESYSPLHRVYFSPEGTSNNSGDNCN